MRCHTHTCGKERERGEGEIRVQGSADGVGGGVVVDKEKKGVGMGSVGSPSLWYFRQHTKQGACVCTVFSFLCAQERLCACVCECVHTVVPSLVLNEFVF